MSIKTMEIINMLEMLPEADQTFAYEFIKKLVLAWDSDFSKLTENERKGIETSEEEMKNGDYIGHNDINWD